MFSIKIKNINKTFNYDNAIALKHIMEDANLVGYVCKVNNRLRELNYIIDYDANVEFLDLSDADGVRVYQTTLRFLLIMAVKKLYPKASLRFSQNISRTFLCVINGIKETDECISSIKNELDNIIGLDLPITRCRFTKDEAFEIYKKEGYTDKINILKYRQEDYVNMNKCGDYYNYMYGYLAPSTSYIKEYNLIKHAPGFLVQYPRFETKGEIPAFEDAPALNKMIHESYLWSRNCKVSTLASMNEFTNDRAIVDFVNMCETKHTNMLADLGLKIKENIDKIKLIAIAGPSSSGKTTFCNRLRIELMSLGIFPLMISIDDYYKNRTECPIGEDGKPDFEDIEALDLAFFNKQINDLINGEEVSLPTFNFKTGKRELGAKVKLGNNQPILIEGIHALNEKLTSSLPRENKYKIYISPFPQINIDHHNPIIVTDIRMLRRVVRDNNFRHTSPEQTFDMWPSVRRGEFKWIYPFQEEADFTYNTELTYELMVMKKYALPALMSVSKDSSYYIEANRLIKFLKYVKDIDDKYVPCNSILREFIGGSCFYE